MVKCFTALGCGMLSALVLGSPEACAQYYAVEVVASDPTDNGPPFNDTDHALGWPDASPNDPEPRGLYSLGAYGSIDLRLGEPLRDITGPDLIVWEETTAMDGRPPDEDADVFVSFDALNWVLVGSVVQQQRDSMFLDIAGLGLEGAEYVRVVDTSAEGDGAPYSGFDLDAIELSICWADYNNDDAVNTLDVLAFLNAWAVQEPSADINKDGEVNTLDVLVFLNAWTTGCP